MFNFLKKKKEESKATPPLADLNNEPLAEGDTVESLRYGLGICRVVMTEQGLAYQSVEDGKQVTWHRMVDAVTELQKVKKVKVEEA